MFWLGLGKCLLFLVTDLDHRFLGIICYWYQLMYTSVLISVYWLLSSKLFFLKISPYKGIIETSLLFASCLLLFFMNRKYLSFLQCLGNAFIIQTVSIKNLLCYRYCKYHIISADISSWLWLFFRSRDLINRDILAIFISRTSFLSYKSLL